MSSDAANDYTDDNSSRSDRDPLAYARRKVAWIGIALISVAVVGLVSNIGLAMRSIILYQATPQPQPPANLSEEEKANSEGGREASPAIMLGGTVILFYLIYIPVLLGGLALRSGKNRTLGIVGAVIGMFPCSIVFLIGLPIGIWALVVLSQPDVVDALSQGKRRPRRDDNDDDDRPRRRRNRDDDDEDDRPRRRPRDDA